MPKLPSLKPIFREVVNRCVSGHYYRVRPTIRRKISAVSRVNLVEESTVGITRNPERRFANYSGWDRMILVFKTRSIGCVKDMEADLFDHQKDFVSNVAGGGGGDYGKGPYYLYVVVRYPRIPSLPQIRAVTEMFQALERALETLIPVPETITASPWVDWQAASFAFEDPRSMQ